MQYRIHCIIILSSAENWMEKDNTFELKMINLGNK